jgi:DNA-binding NtrC family response regulator
LKTLARENGKPVRELSSDALEAILDYHWPGNVRELRAAIERGVVMCNGPKITLRHLPESLREGPRAPGDGRPAAASAGDSLDLAAMELEFIRRALRRTGGNRTDAAKLLGISRRTLQRKLHELSVEA